MFDVSFDGILDEFLAQLTGGDGIRLQEPKNARTNGPLPLPDGDAGFRGLPHSCCGYQRSAGTAGPLE